jgi:hypothetical protein
VVEELNAGFRCEVSEFFSLKLETRLLPRIAGYGAPKAQDPKLAGNAEARQSIGGTLEH